jgi:hypothetical protein
MAKKSETAPPLPPAESPSSQSKMEDVLGSKLATVAVVGLGVALIEAELIPGMLIGIGAMLAPDLMSKLGTGLRPFIKGAMRAGYSLAEKAKETVAEAAEQYQDMVAEVHSEQGR